MNSFRLAAIALAVALLSAPLAASASAGDHGQAHPAPAQKPGSATPAAERCAEHGVKKTICVRCNPKLAAVYKKKGDWCPEHARPESQCVLCNGELAAEGVK